MQNQKPVPASLPANGCLCQRLLQEMLDGQGRTGKRKRRASSRTKKNKRRLRDLEARVSVLEQQLVSEPAAPQPLAPTKNLHRTLPAIDPDSGTDGQEIPVWVGKWVDTLKAQIQTKGAATLGTFKVPSVPRPSGGARGVSGGAHPEAMVTQPLGVGKKLSKSRVSQIQEAMESVRDACPLQEAAGGKVDRLGWTDGGNVLHSPRAPRPAPDP